jgi:hypothetical protein
MFSLEVSCRNAQRVNVSLLRKVSSFGPFAVHDTARNSDVLAVKSDSTQTGYSVT